MDDDPRRLEEWIYADERLAVRAIRREVAWRVVALFGYMLVMFGAGMLLRPPTIVALACMASGVLLMLVYVVGRPFDTPNRKQGTDDPDQ